MHFLAAPTAEIFNTTSTLEYKTEDGLKGDDLATLINLYHDCFHMKEQGSILSIFYTQSHATERRWQIFLTSQFILNIHVRPRSGQNGNSSNFPSLTVWRFFVCVAYLKSFPSFVVLPFVLPFSPSVSLSPSLSAALSSCNRPRDPERLDCRWWNISLLSEMRGSLQDQTQGSLLPIRAAAPSVSQAAPQRWPVC